VVAIFVALMFILLVLVDLTLEKWRVRHADAELQKARRAGSRAADVSVWRQLPEGVYLSAGHAWLKPDPTGGIEMGGDAFLAHIVGKIHHVELPKVGSHVRAGQPLFRLEHAGRSIAVPAAVSSRILATNSRLQDHPDWVRVEPYGLGWICYVVPTNRDAQALPSGQRAIHWLENEMTRFRDFLSAHALPDLALGTTHLDGGMPAADCLGELDAPVWTAFEREFLHRASD